MDRLIKYNNYIYKAIIITNNFTLPAFLVKYFGYEAIFDGNKVSILNADNFITEGK